MSQRNFSPAHAAIIVPKLVVKGIKLRMAQTSAIVESSTTTVSVQHLGQPSDLTLPIFEIVSPENFLIINAVYNNRYK